MAPRTARTGLSLATDVAVLYTDALRGAAPMFRRLRARSGEGWMMVGRSSTSAP